MPFYVVDVFVLFQKLKNLTIKDVHLRRRYTASSIAGKYLKSSMRSCNVFLQDSLIIHHCLSFSRLLLSRSLGRETSIQAKFTADLVFFFFIEYSLEVPGKLFLSFFFLQSFCNKSNQGVCSLIFIGDHSVVF